MFNIVLIILLNILNFSLCQIIYEFDKDLNLNENMTINDIYTNLAYNDLYTYIKIGTPEKKLKVAISFQHKSLVILGSNIKRPDIFNESNSSSYNKIISQEFNLIKNQLYNGYISEDIIKLNNFEKSLKIQFFLGEEIYKESYSFRDEYEPINFSGYIGLAIESLFNNELPDSLPIYLYNNYNNNYNFKSPFSIFFDSNNKNSYKGKLIISGYPHEYNNSYHKEEYISTRIQKNGENYLDWCIILDNIYYDNDIIDSNGKIIFRPEIGIIILDYNCYNKITENYFKDYIEKKICNLTTFYLIGEEYKYYYCNKEINLTKFKQMNFELKDINFNFSLNYEDLFYEYNDKYYFLIAASNYKNIYIFGTPLMKKYNLVFDRYNSKIGVYKNIYNNNKDNEDNKNNENNKRNIILIISIIILSILIIIVLIYIIWNYFNKPRAPRKNEINDEYNYIEEPNKIN